MSAQETVLWSSDSASLNSGNGAHQWFTRTGGVLTDSTNIPDLAATGGVWTKVNMSGFDYLRVWGQILLVNNAGWTGILSGIMPYAFGRSKSTHNYDILNGSADEILGANITTAAGNVTAGATRLSSFAIQRTLETTDILIGSDWTNMPRVLPGLLTTDACPIGRAAGAAIGQRRRWFYDVGPIGVSASYTKTKDLGSPLVRCSGFDEVYIAMKILNDVWVGGSGNITVAGEIKAVAFNEGSRYA